MSAPKKSLTLSLRLVDKDHAILLELQALYEKRVSCKVALSEVVRKAIREMHATELDVAE